MCKIFVMSGVTTDNRDKAWELIKKMGDKMSSYNNNDGLGYAAITEEGKLFGERWLYNRDAFEKREAISEEHKSFLPSLAELFTAESNTDVKYNSFGVYEPSKLVSVTLHTRFATSGKEFMNTHPFVEGSTSLIHNGVIRNVHELVLKQSTCDSEGILNEYIKFDVANKPGNIKKVAANLQGYYACGIYTKTDKKQVVLDLFKSEGARLIASYIKDFKTFVFTTDYVDLEQSCLSLGLTLEGNYKVKEGVLVRFNPMTGQVLKTEKFTDQYVPKESGKTITRNDDDVLQEHGDWLYHRESNTWFRRNKMMTA